MRAAALAILLALLTLPAALAEPPDLSDPDAERIISELFIPPAQISEEWWREYRERMALVEEAPERFAPILRERLMRRLPTTLDEYRVGDPQWAINEPHAGDPNPPAGSLLRIVSYLPLAHAEPILQEYFERINPLALEATRRHWEAKEAALATGRHTSDDWVRTLEVYRAITGARSSATNLAKTLGSGVFYDDYVAMLTSDDPIAQATGAAYTRGNLDAILAWRPDALPEILEATTRLSASDQPRVAEAGRALMEAVRKSLQSPARDNTRADPPR
ncbi:MAG: hypothetical protein ACF8QF_06840 [Phycisphaerales bacterium]